MRDKKIVLFDLDGTIIDPKEGITGAFSYTFEQYNMTIEQAILDTYIGPPLVDTFLHYDLNVHEAIEHFRVYFKEKGIKQFTVYDDMETLLKTLLNHGYRLAVATSKPTVYAVDILKSAGLDGYFEFIEGSFLDNTRTNKNEIIQAVMDQMGLPPSAYVMVGDRKHDVLGAKKHKINTVGVTYGYGSKEELISAGADIIVASPLELLGVFGLEV